MCRNSDRQAEIQADEKFPQAEIQTDRINVQSMGRETDRQTDRQTDRGSEEQSDRQAGRDKMDIDILR